MKSLFGLLVPLLVIATPALADDTERFTFGGDQFVAGHVSSIGNGVEHDAFAAGFDVSITAPVAGDAHAAGFTVSITGPVTGNVYAAGNAVTISGAVGADITSGGGTVTLTGSDPVGGNVRAAGGAVTLERPVSGSVMIAGSSLTLDAPIAGDLLLSGEKVSFGDNAKVSGSVEIRGTEPIEVPASVAPADRVTFTKIDKPDLAGNVADLAGKSAQSATGGWMGAVFGFVVLIVVGGVLLALFPRRAETGYLTGMAKPWKSLLFGVLALSAFFGLILVSGLTLIGIPLVPLAIVLLVLACLVGYLAGVYYLADRVLEAFKYESDTIWKRIGALILGLIVVGLLSLVPFLGWLVALGLTLFGLGALSFSAIGRRIDSDFHRRIASDTGLAG